MTRTQEGKQDIRNFLVWSMGDEELTMTLAHAQSGKLSFHSCCCLVGMATIKCAGHAPRGIVVRDPTYDVMGEPHYLLAKQLPGARVAEKAYRNLGDTSDGQRLRILIPILLAEIRRRDRVKKANGVQALELVMA